LLNEHIEIHQRLAGRTYQWDGEITRYIGKYGTEVAAAKGVLIGTLGPTVKGGGQSDGVPASVSTASGREQKTGKPRPLQSWSS